MKSNPKLMKPRYFVVVTLILLVAVTASAIVLNKTRTLSNKNISLLFEKGSSYEEIWKKVDEFDKKGLPQSALEIVEAIYVQAKSDTNYAQIIKSIIYKQKYKISLEEDAYQKIVNELKSEIDSSDYPLNPVLHSLLADVYWSFYQNNRWRFYQRSETVGYNPEDINTWDLDRIIAACIDQHKLALENVDSLQATKLDFYDDILITYPESKRFRPTLYDFIAHRALDFYMNSESELSKPSNTFTVDRALYFSDLNEFANAELYCTDSMSLKYKAMEILQDLIRFHEKGGNEDALIDIDIKRLSFVYQNSIHPEKDSLYIKALRNLEKKYLKNPTSADVSYKIASFYEAEASKYQPLVSDDYKWHLKKAYEYAKEVVRRHPDSHGAMNCEYQMKRISLKSVSFTLENYNAPFKKFKSLVNYKNVDDIYFRIIKLDWKKHRNVINEIYGEDLMKYFVDQEVAKEFKVEMKTDGDFQYHSVELNMPALENGYYLILASSDKHFKADTNALSYGYTQITNLGYTERKTKDDTYDIYAFNRETGEPQQGVSVILWMEKYDYLIQKYRLSKYKTYSTDNDGYVRIPPTSEYGVSYYLELRTSNDKLYSASSLYQYKSYNYDAGKYVVTHFFTDREMYRPGQTVYYKGIMMMTDGENSEILKNYSSTVYLYDVNYQVVGQKSLKTNEFGTFSGSFTAPQGGVTGQMHITNSTGYKYFSVEEYKRPKFEVEFKPVEGSYKLNQTITTVGSASSYAGANIDGAQVKYEVKRSVYFPYKWYWSWWYPLTSEVVVEYGNTVTDEKGEFEINFDAVPDLSVNKEWNPAFTYTITADVTDINGETHSAVQYVNVGYKALVISTNLEDNVNISKINEFEINTANLSGEPVNAKGTIGIYKLKESERLFRSRLWSEPDIKNLSREDYYNLYPFDYYENESDVTKLKVEKKVLDHLFDTEKSKSIKMNKVESWEQGKYKIVINSKDEYGEDVVFEQYITVFSPDKDEVAVNDIGWFAVVDNECEPGETAKFLIGTADSNVKVLYEIEHKEKIVSKKWIDLKDEQVLVEIPIEEKHRGNLAVHFVFIKHGRNFSYNELITVPYSNKKLDIQFETFRNKLYPGEKEEWRIKIKGPDGEKVAAEMLATLYDASLDAFAPNNWYFDIYKTYYSSMNWYASSSFSVNSSALLQINWNYYYYEQLRYYDQLNWFGFYYTPNYYYNNRYSGWDYGETRGGSFHAQEADFYDYDLEETESEISLSMDKLSMKKEKSGEEQKAPAPDATVTGSSSTLSNQILEQSKDGNMAGKAMDRRFLAPVELRKNFSETAFFYPHLETNEDGDVIVKFTVPESLTKWKMLGFAHTKDLEFGLIDNELVTQKDLMIIPNMPRFLRENDDITLSAKITNLSEKDLSGKTEVKLFDALTMKPIEAEFKLQNSSKPFSVNAGQSIVVEWLVKVPEGVSAVTYRYIAQTSKFSDGEENTIPILTNRMLVTESMPLPIRSNQTKTFKFEKLINASSSNTLKHHKLTLEFTANPAWYAVQALPYLIEYPYECAEQVFSRYYSNSIATHIANSSPKIKKVFDSWKNTPGSEALLSNLEKNQELKSLLLEETPWVLQSKDESERKRRVGLLFDLNHMADNLSSARRKLEKLQVSNGGWVWFKGGPDDRYITQHIITGFGHLDHLGVKDVRNDWKIWNMVSRGLSYLDNEIRKDYKQLKKYYDKDELKEDHIGYYQIQYLYARSYFKDIPISSGAKEAFEYYKDQATKYWLNKGRYMQGMISLALNRYNDENTAMDIISSLKENALVSDEMGMYWKDNSYGYYWYQAPIETHALLIEAFDEVAKDGKAVDDLRVWLLKQKQTQDWKTTKATTEAVYALLLRGTDWLATESAVEIVIADQKIDPKKMPDVKEEAGTGYFKVSWNGAEVKPEMGEVKVVKKDEGVSWGALYWQYFEQLDKITPHETPLKLKKKLFVQEQTASGKVLRLIEDNTTLKIGDKVVVRIELKVDRRMEYVHMKDMRASCFEPLNVLSQYKYQDGLGYYESTRDVSTSFFFSVLNKGTYVFEYPLWVTHEGDFSNGITSIQCMYAPEFGSHSEGIRVNVGK